MIDLNTLSYYELLDVDPRATVEELKRAYQIAMRSYGTDHMATYSLFTESEREAIATRVQEAYNILVDPKRRRNYDEDLRTQGLYPKDASEAPQPEPSDIASPEEQPDEIPLEPEEPLVNDLVRDRIDETLASTEEDGEWSGALLKEIRELLGLSLDDIADRTKVSRGHLKSIEESSFDYLPPDVYVKGFITQYARALELDPDHITTKLMETIRKARGAR
jgi:flagellar biosynthesis protein FlhG